MQFQLGEVVLAAQRLQEPKDTVLVHILPHGDASQVQALQGRHDLQHAGQLGQTGGTNLGVL